MLDNYSKEQLLQKCEKHPQWEGLTQDDRDAVETILSQLAQKKKKVANLLSNLKIKEARIGRN